MNIALFVLYCLVITVTPGPTNIMILSVVKNGGVAQGMKFVCGVGAAFVILLSTSVLFSSLLSSVLPQVIIVMQLAGSVYILYLAYKIFQAGSGSGDSSGCPSFRTAFLMQFLNPKVVLFTVTVIPSFVLPYYSSLQVLGGFVVLITVIGIVSMSVWVFAGSLLRSFMNKYYRVFNNLMALFLVYCAIMISGVVEIF